MNVYLETKVALEFYEDEKKEKMIAKCKTTFEEIKKQGVKLDFNDEIENFKKDKYILQKNGNTCSIVETIVKILC